MENSIRVLIVDDERRFGQTTAEILGKRGFAVKAVTSGAEALDELAKNPVDVVVLDVKMPGLSGHETLREMRQRGIRAPALMLTGVASPESALEGLKDGVFDYLAKPCPVDLLAERIREAHARVAGVSEKEPRVRDLMLPLSAFGAVRSDQTVEEALSAMLEGFSHPLGSEAVQETAHRSILVAEPGGGVVGIVTFTDLLRGLRPLYMRLLKAQAPMTAAMHLEAPNYSGMFTIMARDLGTRMVSEIMSEAPPLIEADANLMGAATRMTEANLRRLLVAEHGKVVGVIREQELFFEIARTIRRHRQ